MNCDSWNQCGLCPSLSRSELFTMSSKPIDYQGNNLGRISKNCWLLLMPDIKVEYHSGVIYWINGPSSQSCLWWLGGLATVRFSFLTSMPFFYTMVSYFLWCVDYFCFTEFRGHFLSSSILVIFLLPLSKATYSCNFFVITFLNVHCLSISKRSLWL
jgi:hypothetical protein